MDTKQILVIAPYAFGYTAHIKSAIDQAFQIQSHILYLDKPAFKYRSGFHKAQNFFYKLFGKNLKKSFVFDRIKDEVKRLHQLDTIFIIRPDILNDATLKFLKSRTAEFIAYYYDSTRRFPRKVDILPFFDTVYSYDKLDVDRYSLKFLTNYIFEESNRKDFDYLFFNISTNDYRFPILESLAGYLKAKRWSYNIQVYNGSDMPSEHVEVITVQKSIEAVAALIKASKIIVEIQRTEQVGLSFRAFEALGHRKKLITTNKDIVNYDFYDPQNILVIDVDTIEIPEEFVNSPYKKIDPKILDKYKVENWVKPIFGLE